jgi:Arc/MetJ family transcription regulator
MLATVELNDTLLSEAMEWAGESTNTAVVNEALKQYVQLQKRMRLIEMAGQVHLEVDLDATRGRR